MKVLYLSYDGMTDPLGQSQVIPYLAGLSKGGHEITLISFEKQDRLDKTGGLIVDLMLKHQINWKPLVYTKSPPVLSTVWDLLRMKWNAEKIIKSGGYHIVHCRSYIASIVGLGLKKKFGTRFIFDMRGFWADERVEGNLWNLRNPIYNHVYKYFKKKEKEFLIQADEVISLTHHAAGLIQKWRLKGNDSIPVTVIPCCADLEHFSLQAVEESKRNEWKNTLAFGSDDFIVGYLGAIGTWYMLDEMLDFFKILLEIKPEAKFLFITQEPEKRIFVAAKKKQISEKNLVITPSSRQDLPSLLSLISVSIFFIRPSFSKQASSPTKQGEIMGMGIPIICNSGIGDTDEIILNSNAGIVINEFSKDAYKKAALEAITLPGMNKENIVAGARRYFSLNKGVEKYLEIYRKLEKSGDLKNKLK